MDDASEAYLQMIEDLQKSLMEACFAFGAVSTKLKFIKDKYCHHFKSISDESFPSQRMMIEDFNDDINELISLMRPE